MNVYVAILFSFILSQGASANTKYTESKRRTWVVVCERTFFKFLMDNIDSKNSLKELSKTASTMCEDLAKGIDKEKKHTWDSISNPVGDACVTVIKAFSEQFKMQDQTEKNVGTYCLLQLDSANISSK